MILTVLIVAFVAGLFVPRTWQWIAGAIVVLGIGWAVVIAFLPDSTLAIVAGAAVLGAVNAAIGLGVGLVVRRLVKRGRAGA